MRPMISSDGLPHFDVRQYAPNCNMLHGDLHPSPLKCSMAAASLCCDFEERNPMCEKYLHTLHSVMYMIVKNVIKSYYKPTFNLMYHVVLAMSFHIKAIFYIRKTTILAKQREKNLFEHASDHIKRS